MSDASVMLSFHSTTGRLYISGRGTFVISQKIRSTGLGLIEAGAARLLIHLSECCSLDSSCMGVLAMIALKGREKNVRVELEAVSPKVDEQLKGLGIKYLFAPLSAPCEDPRLERRPAEADDGVDVPSLKQTILEAHKTLGEASPENIERFRGVIAALEKEG